MDVGYGYACCSMVEVSQTGLAVEGVGRGRRGGVCDGMGMGMHRPGARRMRLKDTSFVKVWE